MVDFVDAIVNDKKIEPNLYDGMRNAEVLDAGIRSAATGTRVSIG